MIVEIVAQSADDAVAAERAGASRIELVSALSLGGLTPSLGTLEETRARCRLPVIAMLRPRSGGFDYTAGEFAAILRDGERFVDAGAAGLVFGVLSARGEIDIERNREIVALGGEAVFHRAFDALPDPFEALEILVELGFQRILTSGGRGTALQGVETLSRLQEQAAGRIEILPGGGVRRENAAEIVSRTGIRQVHLAGQEWVTDSSTQGLGMSFNGTQHPEEQFGRVDEAVVAAMVNALAQA
jgi:copper homeostasis protein